MRTAELTHLIKMINQIANNIAIGQSDSVTAPKVADHIRRFWAPQMKELIIAYARDDGADLNSVSLAAVDLIQ